MTLHISALTFGKIIIINPKLCGMPQWKLQLNPLQQISMALRKEIFEHKALALSLWYIQKFFKGEQYLYVIKKKGC